ncbi:MAG: helix-turn-helix transcriptional regulator [Bacillota bacterium]|nr:helix-turn-helix transcriptional regulator [Bacillota bacterium]
MTPGERVKKIRKEKELTLEKFGERVGVTKQTISRIENGINSLTEQMIISICREFDINEEWLRSGSGEMETEITKEDYIVDFVSKILKSQDDSFKKRYISMLSRLDEKGWEALERVATAMQQLKED